MENCIFCKIINGEIPSYKIWEDNKYIAILTIRPQKTGHSMVIPKKHEDYVFDMEDAELQDLMIPAKKIAGVLKKTFKPSSGKIAMLIMGIGVHHVHVHLIPFEKEEDVNPALARDASKEELIATFEKIKANL